MKLNVCCSHNWPRVGLTDFLEEAWAGLKNKTKKEAIFTVDIFFTFQWHYAFIQIFFFFLNIVLESLLIYLDKTATLYINIPLTDHF